SRCVGRRDRSVSPTEPLTPDPSPPRGEGRRIGRDLWAPNERCLMDRRDFLQTGAAAGLALSAAGYHISAAQDPKRPRVGLIGCGWYGKCDLFRLIQVAPVEVVSLCDVDRRLLDEAAKMVAARQASKRRPQTFGDYRKMLAQKDLDIVL